MDILYILIPVSLILLSIFVAGFYWTLKSGQYDDLDAQAHRILFDNQDDIAMTPKESRIEPDRDRN